MLLIYVLGGGFRGGPLLDIRGSYQLLSSFHVRERDKMLLRSVMVGGVWNGFLLSKVRGEVVLCRFCGGTDGDGHLFWECPYPPLVEIRENPEFHDLMRMDKSHWPRCLLWHDWLAMLSGVNGASPWADSADHAAVYMLENALGSYSSDILQGWDVPQSVDWGSAAKRMPPSPDVWTDGSHVRDEVSGSAFTGAGVTGGTGVGSTLMISVLLLMVCPLHVWVLALCLVPYKLSRGLSFGVWCLPCRLRMLFTLVLTISTLFGMLVVFQMVCLVFVLLSLWMMVTLSSFSVSCFPSVVRVLCVFPRSRVMLMRVLSVVVKCGPWIFMVILVLMKLLTLVVVGFGLMLLMLGGIFLVYVGGGILLFCSCIVSVLPFSRAVVNCDDSSGLAPHPLVWSAGGLP